MAAAHVRDPVLLGIVLGRKAYFAGYAAHVLAGRLEEDVCRLEVPVDHTEGVKVVHASGNVYQAAVQEFQVWRPIDGVQELLLHDGPVQCTPAARRSAAQ